MRRIIENPKYPKKKSENMFAIQTLFPNFAGKEYKFSHGDTCEIEIQGSNKSTAQVSPAEAVSPHLLGHFS